MARENALTRALAGTAKQGPAMWVEGRFIMYRSSYVTSPEIKERGGRWDGRNQCWRLPRLTREARFLLDYDPDATPTRDVRRIAAGEWETSDAQVFGAFDFDAGFLPRLEKLFPFQREAVAAIVARPYHGLGAILTPGLGKTPTSIVAAEMLCAYKGIEHPRILIVSPLPLCMNWYREITGTQIRNPFQWAVDPRVEMIYHTDPVEDDSVVWTIANVDSVLERAKNGSGQTVVTGNLNHDFDRHWDVLILEESILYKNRKSKRSSVMASLQAKADKVIELSGAPKTKYNSDLWQQLNIMEPDYFSSFWRWANQSCIVVQTPWSKGEIIGDRKDFDTRAELPELLFIRNQEEVFDDLPEYIYKDIELPLTRKQQKAHDDIMATWLHELEENPSKRVEVTAVIAMLTRLQQVTSNLYNLETTGHKWPDESTKADFVCSYLGSGEYTPDYPVLVWTHHRPGQKALYDRLIKLTKDKKSPMFKRRVEMVHGSMKAGEADRIIEDYKDGKVDVLLLGITVGKYGHTLAITHTVICYDKVWDSDAWFQMLHRAAGARAKIAGYHHRPLFMTLRCRGTVDDFVELNLAGKLPGMAQLTGADLAKVLRSLGEDHVVS